MKGSPFDWATALKQLDLGTATHCVDVDPGIHLQTKWPGPKNMVFPFSAFKSGHVLDKMTEHVWTYMPEDAAAFVNDHICNFPEGLSFGSMCSGSGMDHAAALSLENVLHGLGIKTKFICVFQCEKEAEKRRWLARHCRDGDDPCMYTDVRHMTQRKCTGVCDTHKRACHIPSSDVLFAGTSCKDFSRFNQSRSSSERMNLLENCLSGKGKGQQSTSFETFIAAYTHIQVFKPSVVFLENSDGILDTDKANVAGARSNVEVVLQFLADLGYEAQSFIATGTDFACPQKRTRFWVIAVLLDSPYWAPDVDFDDLFNRIQNRLRDMKLKAPRFRDCLLKCEHSYVTSELQRRLKVRQNKKEGEGKTPTWPRAHQEFCAANGMRWPPAEFPSFAASDWVPTLTDRERGVARMLQRQLGQFTTVDVSQEMGFVRSVAEDQHALPTMLPNTQLFAHLPEQKKGDKIVAHAVSRSITGLELLRIQGFPVFPSDDCMKGDDRFSDLTCGHRAITKQEDAMNIVHTLH